MSDELKEEGLALFRQGHYEEALLKFEEAAAAYAQAGDGAGRAEMLNNIGVIRRVQRDWAGAAAAFDEAETIFRQLGADNKLGQVLGNLGDLYAYQGDAEAAARSYSDGAELFAANGDREKQAQLLRALSLLNLRRRRVVEAIYLMEQSLAVRPHLNLPQRLFHALIRFALMLAGGR